jgi:hypothetical protein
MTRRVLIAGSFACFLVALAIFGTAVSLSDPRPPVPPTQTARVVVLKIHDTAVPPATPVPTRTRTIYDDMATSTAYAATYSARGTAGAVVSTATAWSWTPTPPFRALGTDGRSETE